MAGIVRDEARHDPSRGFAGGYEMETLSLGVPFLAAFLDPGAWGRSFTSAMDSYSNMAGMWLIGEDMPQETNRVTLDPKIKDKIGLPVASVHFDDHPNDLAMRTHAYQQGSAIYSAVGATRTMPTPPYPSTHNMGTNRMSEKPRDGVGEQVWPDARREEFVRLGRQPVHQRRGLQPDADYRQPGDPPGGQHCRHDAAPGDLAPTAGCCSAGRRCCREGCPAGSWYVRSPIGRPRRARCGRGSSARSACRAGSDPGPRDGCETLGPTWPPAPDPAAGAGVCAMAGAAITKSPAIRPARIVLLPLLPRDATGEGRLGL